MYLLSFPGVVHNAHYYLVSDCMTLDQATIPCVVFSCPLPPTPLDTPLPVPPFCSDLFAVLLNLLDVFPAGVRAELLS